MHNKKGKSSTLLFKIDFEKAYDRVNWDFLKLTLIKFGFLKKITELIMNCVSATSLSLEWNNENLPSFTPRRGLRQGYPLSPYLFLLFIEKLAILINELVHENKWQSLSIKNNGPRVSHFFFVDDCLLFSKACASQVELVKEVLERFCVASGLKVSVDKSRFYASKNVSNTKRCHFPNIINFQYTSNPGKYLGFPIFTSCVTKREFNFILDHIQGKLCGWKSKLLNRAGRMTLSQSVLASIPSYVMNNYLLPRYL